MDGREQRGLEIAATNKIRRMKNLWFVPSSNNSALYEVRLEGETKTCTCLDFETRQITCKHIHAVTFTLQRETRPDGSLLETRSVRVTYGQNWPAYNAAQTHEKERVTELLRGLCDGIVQPAQSYNDRLWSTTIGPCRFDNAAASNRRWCADPTNTLRENYRFGGSIEQCRKNKSR